MERSCPLDVMVKIMVYCYKRQHKVESSIGLFVTIMFITIDRQNCNFIVDYSYCNFVRHSDGVKDDAIVLVLLVRGKVLFRCPSSLLHCTSSAFLVRREKHAMIVVETFFPLSVNVSL